MVSSLTDLKYICQIFDIEKNCFEKDFWSIKSIESSLTNKNYFYKLAFKNEKVVGYVFLVLSEFEAELIKVAVDTSYRRKGFAKKMLQDSLLELQQKNIQSIFLEVRESNESAISLYKKLGFKKIGIRKNFYRFPTEDGIVMKLESIKC